MSLAPDPAHSAGSDLLVVGNNGSGLRIFAAQDHVTASLAAEYEAGTFERGLDFSS